MKHPRPLGALVISTLMLAIHPPTASAAGLSENTSGASQHASKAFGMGIAASGQVTLGIMAAPLLSAGTVGVAVGGASTAAGKASAEAAGLSAAGPLPVTEQTITVRPPADALKQQNTTVPR